MNRVEKKRIGWLWSGLAMAAFAAGGCGGAAEDDGPEVEEAGSLDGKSDALSSIGGTWREASTTLLVLKNDKTYHKEQKVLCVNAPCHPIEENGTFKLTRSGTRKYITLANSVHGVQPLKYRYTLSGDMAVGVTLKLQQSGTTIWKEFTRDATGWCAVASDCDAQNLISILCVGQWTCATNTCSFKCGTPIDRREGESCGGLAGLNCGDGLYCSYTVDENCGAGDVPGTCAKKPVGECAPQCNPTYGCDGKRYLGTCEPAKKGVSIRSFGFGSC